jgi:hypothetical protein
MLAPEERWWGKIASGALIETKPTTPVPWLYNLSSDLGETRNVAADHPEIVERLSRAARAFDLNLEAHSRPVFSLGPTAQKP